MHFSYGLLSEGDSDLLSLDIIIRRLGARIGHSFVQNSELSIPVSGPISKTNVRLRTYAFIEANLDLGFYLADDDRGNVDKKQMITENIDHVNSRWVERSVIGIPQPHMEAWLIADQDTIKNYLGISSGKALPHSDQQPKSRLKSLVTEYGEEQLTLGELRKILADTMNIDIVMSRDSSFAAFESSIRSAINVVTNQQERE